MAQMGRPLHQRSYEIDGDEGHGLAKKGNRADAVPKALAFLARHLAG